VPVRSSTEERHLARRPVTQPLAMRVALGLFQLNWSLIGVSNGPARDRFTVMPCSQLAGKRFG